VILQSQPSGADAWVVLAGRSSLLALPPSESARASELAAALDGPDGFRSALESLVGGGIASAPHFALLDGDAVVLRVVLRGDAAITARLEAAEVEFSGVGMATWTERVVEGATSLRLAVPGSSWTVLLDQGATPGGVADGAPASVATPQAAPSPQAAPAPAATPAPPPGATAPGETTWVPKSIVEEPQADPDSEAYDFLFGDTIYRTQAGVSIRIPNPDPERPGDHDGQTMLAADLGRPVAASPAAASPAADAAPAPIAEAVFESVSEATVLAPVSLAAPAIAEPVHAPSLPLGPTLQLERPDGSREPLSRPVLIGRSPSAFGSDARLIAIVDDPDISRTHLRVAVEGDAVVVTDLGSKNGSMITLPGAAPRKLRASEPTVVLPGTLIDLGGGTTFTVRED